MDAIRSLTGPGLFRLGLSSVVVVHHISRFTIGGAAVYVFFCLSGFWIYKMWVFRYSKTRNPYVTYLTSRAWRLIPTFALIALLTIGVELALGYKFELIVGPIDQLRFCIAQVFILGYANLPFKPVGPAWSLDIEMQFYIIAPLLIIAAMAISRNWILLTAVSILSLISALWISATMLTTYLIFFLAGIMVAKIDWRPSAKFAAVCGFIGIALIAACVLSPMRGILLLGSHPGPLSEYNAAANVSLAVLAFPYAMYTTRQAGSRLDPMFGDLSYIVYLLHWAGAILLGLYASFGLSRLSFTAIICALIYAASFAIWKVYDLPINRLRAKWVSSRNSSISWSASAVPGQ